MFESMTTAWKPERFGLVSSGHALLYDENGRLLFSGGLTNARGHAGNSVGRNAIVAILNDTAPETDHDTRLWLFLVRARVAIDRRGVHNAGIKTSPEIVLSTMTRAGDLFDQQQSDIFKRTDRLFCSLLAFQWFAAISAALWISPFTWEGAHSRTHIHVWTAVFLGGAIISLPVAMVFFRPGHTLTRHFVGIAQMLMGALLIHLTGRAD